MASIANQGSADSIILSHDDSDVDCVLDDTDDDAEEEGSSWTCQQCSTVNSQYAGDCSSCGLIRGEEPVELDAAPGPSEKGWDLVEATQNYLRTAVDESKPVALDTCNCSVERSTLKQHVSGLVKTMPADCDSLAGHFSCPNSQCSTALTPRDIITVLDDDACAEVDEHVFHVVEGELQMRGHTADSNSRYKKARVDSPPASAAAAIVAEAIVAAKRSLDANVEASGSGKAGASATAAATQQDPSNARPNQRVGQNGLPKGTGYGGAGRYGREAPRNSQGQQDMTAQARAREGAADQQMVATLRAVKSSLEATSIPAPSGHQMTTPLVVSAVVYGGPLAFILRRLLQNDSLLDIGQRSELYWATLQLLQFLGKRLEFVLLFHKPAADPTDDEPDSAPSILDALETLNTQCLVFKRSASELVSEEEVSALSLALEIGAVFDELQKVRETVHKARRRSLSRAPHTPHGEPDPKDVEKWYCQAMSKFRFGYWPLNMLQDFHFRKEAAGGGFSSKKTLLRLSQEISSLATSVPVSFSSSVFLVADDDARMDMMRACIVGPEGTPYENGVFLFDIWLPPSYPEVPPKVQFLTTGGGRVRFNPNLYDTGKVCLSLLGTWDGPSWDPKHSTILQVLVSIQSMIFVEDPYFNEPGFENTAGSQSGRAHSEGYNARVRRDTLLHALLPALKKPPAAFKDALLMHFHLKKEAILKQLGAWEAKDAGLQRLSAQAKELLQATPKPA